MTPFRVGLIGCSKRGNIFAHAYQGREDVQLVACADLIEDNAQQMARKHRIPKVYTDFRKMLEQEQLDIVNVCTRTRQHPELVIAAAESGVRAVCGEKPMAPTWGEARRQYEACASRGVQSFYCHQRRFDPLFRRAKQLIDSGAIGRLIRVEGCCRNLFDWGTHWFDMFFHYNNDQPAVSVMGQIDARDTHTWFDIPMEGSGISWVQFQSGLQGLMVTGLAGNLGRPNTNRILGQEGMIEVGSEGMSILRLFDGNGGWHDVNWKDDEYFARWESLRQRIRDEENKAAAADPSGKTKPVPEAHLSGMASVAMALGDAIECLKTGAEPMLSGRKALQATELIFATYESSRRRAKVILPLDVEDSAFLTMLADGTIKAS